jgi:hypothetical protein
VLESEHLSQDQTLVQVCDFLAVAPSAHPLRKLNDKTMAPMDEALRGRLEDRFREPNERLAALLECPPSWAR